MPILLHLPYTLTDTVTAADTNVEMREPGRRFRTSKLPNPVDDFPVSIANLADCHGH